MKKLFIISALLSALVYVSCKKDTAIDPALQTQWLSIDMDTTVVYSRGDIIPLHWSSNIPSDHLLGFYLYDVGAQHSLGIYPVDPVKTFYLKNTGSGAVVLPREAAAYDGNSIGRKSYRILVSVSKDTDPVVPIQLSDTTKGRFTIK